uniref:Uncharacterized protein n=1 Tax=viral metagenome TaxID=1070528 RepID=A0A6M3JRI6_9ZZZZ
MSQYIRYTGPKRQKQVTWLDARPIWNEANNWTVSLDDDDAAKLVGKCSGIFKLVSEKEAGRRLERQEADSQREGKEMTRRKKKGSDDGDEGDANPQHDDEKPQQLFGKSDGSPFSSKMSAKSQKKRIAKTYKVKVKDLEVVQFADGFWLAIKQDDEDGLDIDGAGEEG